MTRTHDQFMSEVDSILARYVGPSFAQQFGPKAEPLTWDDDSDLDESDREWPTEFELGQELPGFEISRDEE